MNQDTTVAAADTTASNPDQKTDTENRISLSVLRVYFFVLVFATIVNRILEYIKLIFRWLWPRSPFLQEIGTTIWQTVKTELDKLNMKYDEEKMRNLVNRTIISAALYGLGFILGITICTAFKLGVIDELGWTRIHAGLNYVITGILVGAGIEPIHSVFRLAQEKRKKKRLEVKTTVKPNI